MPRPTRFRKVGFFPEETYFVPLGKPKCELEEVALKVEELEAIRLKDIEDLSQEECARMMQVSRQTFQNIIDSARKKVALALTGGKAIRIGGGSFKPDYCRFTCSDCGNEYEVNYEKDKYSCPSCGSERVMCSRKAGSCRKWCQEQTK